jgi:hypothetical protein
VLGEVTAEGSAHRRTCRCGMSNTSASLKSSGAQDSSNSSCSRASLNPRNSVRRETAGGQATNSFASGPSSSSSIEQSKGAAGVPNARTSLALSSSDAFPACCRLRSGGQTAMQFVASVLTCRRVAWLAGRPGMRTAALPRVHDKIPRRVCC